MVTPGGFEIPEGKNENRKRDAILADIYAKRFEVPLPPRSLLFRPVPRLGAESRPQDGHKRTLPAVSHLAQN